MSKFTKVNIPQLAGLPQVIKNIEKALEKLGNTTESAGKKTAKFNEQTKRFYNETGKEVNRLGEAVNRANKRTTMLNNAINALGKEGKRFEFLSLKTFKAYRQQGGNLFEYVAEFLTNSREELRFFGLEVAKFKRFVFGFIPGGFAVINRIGLTLQVLGGTIRAIKRDANSTLEETGEKAGMTAKALGKVFGVLGKRRKIPSASIDSLRMSNQKPNMALQFKEMFEKAKGAFGKIGEGASRAYTKSSQIITSGKNLIGEQFAGMEANKNLKRLSSINKDGSIGKKFRDKTTGKFASGTITPLMKLQFKIATRWRKLKLGTRLKDGLNTLKMIGKKVALFFLSFFALAALVFIFLKAIGPQLKGTAEKAFKVFKVGLGIITGALSIIWESAKMIWDSVFGDGDLSTFIAGLIGMAWGILQLGIGILVAFAGPLINLIYNTTKNILTTLRDKLETVVKENKTGAIFALLVGAVAFFFGAPVWLIAGLSGLAFLVLRKGIPAFVTGIKDALGSILGFAGGGTASGRMNLVGEKGPELVKLPAGSRVYPTGQSKRMMGTSNVFNITINAKDTSDAELRRIADKIGNMVSSKINRRTGFNTSR